MQQSTVWPAISGLASRKCATQPRFGDLMTPATQNWQFLESPVQMPSEKFQHCSATIENEE
jgi:hypothetical protein